MQINRQLFVDYLLKRLDQAGEDRLEEQFFLDDDMFEQLLVVEDELIELYHNGGLSPRERILFEKNYLASPDRRRRMEFYTSLSEPIAESQEELHLLKRFLVSTVEIGRWLVERLRMPPVRRIAFASALAVVLAIIMRPFLFPPSVQQPIAIQNESSSIMVEQPLNVDLRLVYQTSNAAMNEEVPLRFRGMESSEPISKIPMGVAPKRSTNRDSSRLVLTKDDRYSVQIRPESRMYLYIFQWDTSGNIAVLFPDSNLNEYSNPLVPGRSYRVPSGSKWCTLDETPGIETIAFGASAKPWAAMQRGIDVFYHGNGAERRAAREAIRSLVLEAAKNPSNERSGKQFLFVHK